MANLRIEAPDGKTLVIPVPEGTDPSQYDTIVDDVVAHYKSEAMDPRYLEGKMADKSREYPDTWQTEYQPAADLYLTADAARGGVNIVKNAPTIARSIAEGATDLGGTISELGTKAKGAIQGGWDALTGNTPRGFGYAKGVLKTPGMRDAAANAIDMANTPQPELGKLVSEAGAPAGSLPPEGGLAPSAEFETPIRQGILTGSEDMLNAAESQRKQVGQAIEQTLGKYDATGTFYDPTQYNEQVKSLLLRDINGEVMSTGAQGRINEAIKDAASSMNDYAHGGPIKWSDAARVKTMGQGDAKYGTTGLHKAQEAYNTTISMLKEDIDNQAEAMLAKQGGNVQDYQALRAAYGKLESLSQSLNNRVAAKTANSTIPWWIKMAAGGMLAGKAASVVKGITGH